jgi:hypothetical protein
MKRKKIFFLISYWYCVFFYLGTGKATAQNYPDAGSWNTFNIEYGINSRFTALFTEEYRVKENFSRLNLFYTNLGIEYKATKYFKAALVYRFIDKYQDDNTFSYRHRLMLDLTLKKKFGKFGLSYRQRLQAEKRDIYSSDDGTTNEWYSRNKFAVKYDLDKPYTPYVSVELRYQLHNPRKIESDQTWHRVRYVVGVDYKLNDRSAFGVYYLIQREWNVIDPQHQYIVGLEYTLSL